MKYILFIAFFSIFIYFQQSANAFLIKACTDDRGEFPNIIFANNKVTGVWVDILDEALIRLKKDNPKLDIKIKIDPIPITKCQSQVELGNYDVIITSSYNKRRANFFNYPPDSDREIKPCSSKFRFLCAGYVVLSPKKINGKVNTFEFNGKAENLPDLVFVDLGRSIIGDLEELGIVPRVSNNYKESLNKMLKEGGVSILPIQNGITASQDSIYSNLVTMHKFPFSMKSYYIPFSKSSEFPQNLQNLFWSSIANVRSDKKLLRSYYKKYN